MEFYRQAWCSSALRAPDQSVENSQGHPEFKSKWQTKKLDAESFDFEQSLANLKQRLHAEIGNAIIIIFSSRISTSCAEVGWYLHYLDRVS